MAQSGVYSPTQIQEVDLIVRVNGIPREIESVLWGGDTTGGLPDQVVSSGTGMRARTGEVRWATPPLEATSPHPLRQENGWPPREGDRIEIDAVVGGVTFRRFTGRLGATTGSLVNASLSSKFSDTISSHLTRMVNIPPRLTGSHGHSYRAAWEALEQAGLGLLSPLDIGGEIVVQSTPQGDEQPFLGSIYLDNGVSSTDPYGIDVWDDLSILPVEGPTRAGRGILTVARASVVSPSILKVAFSTGEIFRLHRAVDDSLLLTLDGVTIWTGAWEGEGIPILGLYVGYGWAYVATSRSTTGAVQTASVSSGLHYVSGTKIAGTQVRYGEGDDFTGMVAGAPVWPTVVRMSSVPQGRTRATRGFENVPASTVVDSWGDATLSSAWMDEFGKPRLVARDWLLAQSTVRHFWVNERVFEGSWTVGDDSVFRSVIASGEHPAVRSSGSAYRVTVYKDSSPRGFESAVTEERFVEAEAEVDWGPIDLESEAARDWWKTGQTTPLEGTWHSSVVTARSESSDGREHWSDIYGVTHSILIERLGHRTLKLTESVGNIPSGEAVYMKVPSEGSGIDRAVRGQPTPFIRAQWATEWSRFTRSATLGPDYAPVYEHDVSWWLTPADAQRIANALAAEVAQPVPTFSNVTVLWDPRRQIGDIERWYGVDEKGDAVWEARVMIVGYDESWSDGVPTQSVSVRTVSIIDPREGKTYLDLAAAYGTYSGMAGHTYDQITSALPGAL